MMPGFKFTNLLTRCFSRIPKLIPPALSRLGPPPEPSLGSGIGRGGRGDRQAAAEAAPRPPSRGGRLLFPGGWSDKERDFKSYDVAVCNGNTLGMCLKSGGVSEWGPSPDGAYKGLSVTGVLQIVEIWVNRLSLVSLILKSVATLKKKPHTYSGNGDVTNEKIEG